MKNVEIEIEIKNSHNSYFEITKGFANNNELKWFQTKDKSSNFLNFKTKKLIKIDKEKELEMDFQNNQGHVIISEGKIDLRLKVENNNQKNNEIIVNYSIEKEKYELKLKWKEK